VKDFFNTQNTVIFLGVGGWGVEGDKCIDDGVFGDLIAFTKSFVDVVSAEVDVSFLFLIFGLLRSFYQNIK